MFGNLFEKKSKRIGSRRKHDRRGGTGGTLSERLGGRLSRDENVGTFSARVEMLEDRKVLAAFTDGNLALLVAGASASNTTASVIEINTSSAAQTAIQTIALPDTSSADSFRMSGSASSTGYVSRSNDGSLLSFTGHNSTTTTSNANTLLTRGVYTVSPAGTVVKRATYTGTSGQQTRSATSLDNTNWVVGDQGGIYTNSATSASPSGVNARKVAAFGGTMYVGQASGTTTIIQVSTLSAVSAGTVTGLPGLTNNSGLQDFYLIQSGSNASTFDVLYTVSATSNTAGTIAKFSLVSGSWTSNGTYTTTFGGFGLAAQDRDATNSTQGAFLYVSTGLGALAANKVTRLTDTAGYNSTLTISTGSNVDLYSAAAGTIIKGLDFTPAAAAASPTITTTGTLAAVNTTYGTASASPTSFTVSGSSLTGNLTVSAPSGFEISTSSDRGYAASLTLTASSGTVASTAVYARLAAATNAGTYSGNITISGGGASGKTVATASSTVARKALSITSPSISDKTYDGTTTAGAVTVGTLSGFVGTETVTATASAAAYSSADAGTYNSVAITYTLADGSNGGTAANYSLAAGSAAGTVNAKALSITSPSIADKTYNGSTAAGAVTVGTLSGFVGTETVTATASAAAYSSANAGTYSGVAVTYTLADGTNGGKAANYSLAAGSATGTVNAKALSITSPSIADKTYDRTTTAGAVTVGTLSGFVGTETVTATASAAAYSSANAGTYSSVAVTYTLADGTNGGTAANYSLAAESATGTVNAKALTITGLTAQNKNFDGTTAASVTGTGAYSGLVEGESFDVTGTVTWAFADSVVGTAKSLVRTGSYDAPSSNYTVSQPTLSATIVAVVAGAPTINSIDAGNGSLTIRFSPPSSDGGATITDYKVSTDGGTTFTAVGSTSSPIVISGLTNGTDYSVKILAVNSVGDGAESNAASGTPAAPAVPTITVSGLSGTLSATYGTASAERSFTVSGSTLTGDVTVTAPAGLEVSTTSGGTFTNAISLSPTSGAIATTTVYVRLKALADAGAYNNRSITIASSGATDATATTSVSGNIVSPKALSITAPSIASTTYDGTTTAGAVTVGTLSGFVGSETVTAIATAVAYSSANAGSYTTAVNYTLADGTNGGLAANYSLAAGSATGVVSPKALSITAPSIAAKSYDGTTTAGAVTVGTLSGFVGSESVTATATAAAYSSANVGSYTTAVNYTLINGTSGGLAANYSLESGSATGAVNATALTITAAAKTKTYGDADPALTYSSSGLVGSDAISGGLTRDSGDSVGTYAITQGTLDAGSNYAISFTSANLSVTAKALTITGAAATGKVYDGTVAIAVAGGSLSGVVGSDDVSLDGLPSGVAASANAGSQSVAVSGYTLSGAAAGNYSLTQPAGLTATISQAPLTITGAAATNRAYNATTTVAITGGSLSGVIGSDAVTLGGSPTGTIATAGVGTGKAVTVTGFSISGAAAGNYSLSQPTDLTVDIAKANQTITFGALPSKTVADAPFTLAATVSSGLTLTYTSSDPTVASISGNTVTILKIGTATITASQTGNDNYNAASDVQQTLTVTAGPTTLAAGDIAVIGYNTNGSPDAFTILVLKDLNPGTIFYVNDNETSAGGTSFTDLNEGEASFTVKAGQTIAAGTVITLPWGGTTPVSDTRYDWSMASNFGLGNNNEELFIYTASAITATTPSAFIYGVGIGSSSQAAPSGLTLGTTFIKPTGSGARYKTTGATYSGTADALRTAIGNTASNWEASAPVAASDWTFALTQSQTITFGSLSAKTYGDDSFALDATASSGLGITYVSSDPTVASISGSTVTLLKAGSATITASQAGNSSFSAATSVPQTLTVNRKGITVTADGQTKEYGSDDPALTFVTSGLVGSDSVSGSLARAAGESVAGGPYSITQGGVTNAANANYDITFVGASLAVTAKALTVTANNVTREQDQALSGGAGSTAFSSSGLVGAETIGSVSIAYTADTATVGTFTGAVVPSAATGGTFAESNYAITYVRGDLNVSAPNSVIQVAGTLAALSATYGTASTATSFTVSGISISGGLSVTAPAGFELSTDGSSYSASGLTLTPTGSTVAETTIYVRLAAGTAAGTHSGDVGVSGGGAATQGVAIPSSTVSAKAITVTADAKTRTYGDADPTFTYVASGLVGSDSLSGGLARSVGSNVGTYAITQGTLANSNYTISYTGASLTVTPKALSITAPSIAAKTYNALTAAGTVTIGTLSGFVTGQTVTATAAAAAYSSANAGSYLTTVSYTLANGTGGGLASNYTLAPSTDVSGQITPKALSITAPTISSKTYDGTATGGAVTVGTLSGFVGTQTVTATATAAAYSSTNVGSYAGTVVTYLLAKGTNGGLALNYSLANGTATGSITPRALSVTGTTIAPKAYNAAAAAGAVTVGAISGLVGSETLAVTGSAGAFSSANVGSYVSTVSYQVADGTNGGRAANYTLASTAGVAGSITPRILSITTPSIAAKTYDGTTTPGGLTIGTLSGLVGSQTLVVTGSAAAYASANVGSQATTVSYTLANGTGGGLASNYSLTSSPVSGEVTAKALTITANSVTKKPDTSLTTPVVGSTAFGSSGLVAGETVGSVTMSYGAGAAADAAPGIYTGQAVPSAATGGTFSASNYSISYVLGDIVVSGTPTIFVGGTLNAFTTTYGTAVLQSLSVNGANLADDLTVTAPAGFELSTSADGGFTLVSLTLAATDGTVDPTTIYVRLPATAAAATYSGSLLVTGGGATGQSASIPSSIVSPKGLTISGVAIAAKTYDGSTAATITGSPAYVGLVNDQSFSVSGSASATFATSDAGADKAVNVTGYAAPSGNYTVTQPALTGTVNAKALSITAPSIAAKTYDATAAAGTLTIGTLSGFVGSERVTVTGSAAAFSSADVGGYTTTVSYTLADGSGGGKAANYTLAATTGVSGSITAKALSITAPSIAARIYDGSTAAGVLTIGTLSGFVGSETVTATGTAAAYSSANVGSSTTAVSYTLGDGANGGLATNYALASTSGVSGSITAKAITVAGAVAQNKTYDGSTAATITGATLVGVVGSDVVTVGGGGLFASRTVGAGKAVTVQLAIGGAGAANYTLTQPTGLTADITAKQLTLAGAAAQSKSYDGTTAAMITGTLSGVVLGDSVAFVGTGTFATDNRGTVIAVTPTVTIYSPSGTSFTNYAIAQPTGLTADITIGAQSIAAVNIGTRLIGTSITMPAASSQGQPVTYSTSDASIASVSGNVITFNAAGFAKLTATAAGTGNYEAFSYTQTVKVLAAVDAAPVTLVAGDVVVLGYDALANNPDTISLLFLRDLTPGTKFFVSDNEVLVAGGSSFIDFNEAEASFTVRDGQVISAGTVVNVPWGTGTQTTDQYAWTVADNTPGFGQGGDEIYIYNLAASANLNSAQPTSFIYGVAYGSSPSARPRGLTDGQTFIRPTGDTMRYKTTGALYAGAPNTLRSAIGGTGVNWEAQSAVAANYTFLLPQPQVVTFDAIGAKTYGDSTFTLTATAFSGGTVTFGSSDPTVASIAGNLVTILKAGSTTFTASVAGNDQYLAASASQSLTVSRKGVTVVAEAKTKTYGNADPALTYLASGLVGSDSLSGGLGRAAGSNVGTYAVNVGTLANPNYTIGFTGADLAVNAKALTITAGNVTKAGNQALTGRVGSTAFTASGLTTGETIGSVTISYGEAAAAGYAGGVSGTYTDQVIPSAATGGTFSASNYEISYVAGSIVVDSSPTISVSPSSVADMSTTYGTTSIVTTFSVSGSTLTQDGSLTVSAPNGFQVSLDGTTFASSRTISIDGTGAVGTTTVYVRIPATTAAGTYGGDGNDVTVSGGGATAKAVSTTASTVAKRALTISGLAFASRTYDGTTTAPSASAAAFANLANGESFTPSGSVSWAFADKHVGTDKPLTRTGDYAAPSSNYTVTQPTRSATINTKTLTITADAKSKAYGAGDPSLSFASSGLIVGDTLTGNLSRAAGTAVGTYAINQGSVSAGSNYAINFTTALFTIAKRAVTITADALSKLSGQSDPTLTWKVSTSTPLATGDTAQTAFAGSPTRAAGETQGTYAISQGTLDATNYTINFVGANFTVLPATTPLKINGMFVKGSTWASGYQSLPNFTTVGSSNLGWSLADGATQLTDAATISWSNVNTVSVRFNQAVTTPAAGAFSIVFGGSTAAAASTTALGVPTMLEGGTVAQWTLGSNLATGKYRISATSSLVSASGDVANTLDGEWTTYAGSFAAGSGDGTSGGDFAYDFDVLVGNAGTGDINSSTKRENMAVNINDNTVVTGQVGKALSALNFRCDVNGDSRIDSTDQTLVQARIRLAAAASLTSTYYTAPTGRPRRV